MSDKQISVTLTQAAWQQIVNLLDQERNVVKAMPRDTSPLGSVLNFIQDGIVSGSLPMLTLPHAQSDPHPSQCSRPGTSPNAS